MDITAILLNALDIIIPNSLSICLLFYLLGAIFFKVNKKISMFLLIIGTLSLYFFFLGGINLQKNNLDFTIYGLEEDKMQMNNIRLDLNFDNRPTVGGMVFQLELNEAVDDSTIWVIVPKGVHVDKCISDNSEKCKSVVRPDESTAVYLTNGSLLERGDYSPYINFILDDGITPKLFVSIDTLSEKVDISDTWIDVRFNSIQYSCDIECYLSRTLYIWLDPDVGSLRVAGEPIKEGSMDYSRIWMHTNVKNRLNEIFSILCLSILAGLIVSLILILSDDNKKKSDIIKNQTSQNKEDNPNRRDIRNMVFSITKIRLKDDVQVIAFLWFLSITALLITLLLSNFFTLSDWVLSYFVALGTLGMAFSILYPKLFEKPVFDITLKQEEPFCREAPTENLGGLPSYWVRLGVSNEGKSVAKNCEGQLTKVRDKNNEIIEKYVPLILRWSSRPLQTPTGEYTPHIDINRGASWFLDILTIFKKDTYICQNNNGEKSFLSRKEYDSTHRKVSGLKLVGQIDSKRAYICDIYSGESTGTVKYLNPGEYYLDVTTYCENAEAETKTLYVRWGGKWGDIDVRLVD